MNKYAVFYNLFEGSGEMGITMIVAETAREAERILCAAWDMYDEIGEYPDFLLVQGRKIYNNAGIVNAFEINDLIKQIEKGGFRFCTE